MKKDYYIGLMSGTSVDSLDAALVDFTHPQPLIVSTHSQPIDDNVKDCVHQLAIEGNNEIAQLRYLDQKIAQLSCQAVSALCTNADLPHTLVKAIGSHGQTVRHYPKTQQQSGYSLQVGDPNIIAQSTGITTIADFRRRDIAAGGHGAPLAPAFHNALMHNKQYDRIILNTGGIANITLLLKMGKAIGYDTGPANGLMDSWCQTHLNTPYDNNGDWASSGKVDKTLLNILLKHPFFSLKAPKSTGREDFNLPWLEKQLALTGQQYRAEDVQATLLALTVESIAREIEQCDNTGQAEVYICGGGAHNTALTDQLSQRLHPRKLSSTEALGIHPDWVEAVAFAWLAKQTIEHLAGNLPSVTGANQAVILGGIYLANR